jgi:hypothetical protein
MTDRVALFARAPIAGQVKTRLAAAIGDAAALQAHRDLVRHALQALIPGSSYELEVWCSQMHPEIEDWVRESGLPLRIQQGDDLGSRMAHCLQQLCRDGDRGLIVGCDCPMIDADYAALAFAALDRADLVLGPAEDGGYGLIAWARPQPPDIFRGMTWSHSEVLSETLKRAAQAGLSVITLPMIWDVDTEADWRRFCAFKA